VSRVPTVFVGGPFSSGLVYDDEGDPAGLDPELKRRLERVHSAFRSAGCRLLSSHIAEKFGLDVSEHSLVKRDNSWLSMCDLYAAVLPFDSDGSPWRTDGTFVEIGLAVGQNKPVLLIIEEPARRDWSYYVRDLGAEETVEILPWAAFEKDPEGSVRDAIGRLQVESTPKNARQIDVTHVEEFLERCRVSTEPYTVHVAGLDLLVHPGVFSPAFSRSSEMLIDSWKIAPGKSVLDAGCGTGLLGIAALREGASHITAFDINPLAVSNTRANLERLGLTHRATVLESDCYQRIEGKFDVIVSNPPFWDKRAKDTLELACYDEGYRFVRGLISNAHKHARPGAQLFVVFSDQGDIDLVVRLLQDSGWYIYRQTLGRPTRLGGHIRVVWEARLV
jgi:methylase of polypeptide subunit release factors